MMIAYNLRRKDYTNSLARLGLKHPAGFTLQRRQEAEVEERERTERG